MKNGESASLATDRSNSARWAIRKNHLQFRLVNVRREVHEQARREDSIRRIESA
jgi:hypothetical protein